jgi:uncharacterized protein (TIGR02147 family)
MTPSIFLYLDYRQYLNDAFESFREADSSFSYRKFARLAGSTSPNLLQLIHSRRLNISSAQVSALASAFELNNKEEKYFETIVAFDHAKTHTEKDKFFQRVLLTREYLSIKTIEKKQYEYLSHWYNPVIRELIIHPDYPDDPEWIAEHIIPAITPGKVKKGIDLLVTLDLIRRSPDSKTWIQTDSIISTPSEVLSMAVVKYHQDIIALARESIERFQARERDIRAVTIGVSKKRFGDLKKRMEAFWKEILAFADTNDHTDQVLQVNLQMFPLSKRKEKKK